MDLSEAELVKNMQQSATLYQTLVYRRIYQEALCTLGGDPFGMILLDYKFEFLAELSQEQREITQLMTELGEISMCPMIFGLSDNWIQESISLAFCSSRLERLGQAHESYGFQNLRQKNMADFLAVTWPRLTLKTSENKEIFFHGGYALLALVLREFGLYGWFAGLLAWGKDIEGGSRLPVRHGIPVAELKLTESLESSYADLGIMSLSSAWLDNTAGFYVMPMAGCNQENETRQSLPPLLILCRFAHYLKVMIRDRIGRMDTPQECCSFLQRWLDGYCSQSNFSDISYLASYPLKWARMKVYEGNEPGRYLASLALFPNLPPGFAKVELTVRLQLSSES